MTEVNEAELDETKGAVEATETTEEEVVETDAEEGEEEDAESEDEGSEEEEEEQEVAPKNRGAKRIQTLSQRLKEESAARKRLEDEVAEMRNRTSQPQVSPVEQQRLRDEKLALMSQEERKDYLRDEEITLLKQSQIATQMHIIDATDKASYDAKATLNPVYAKHQAAVEKALATLRSKGNNASREELLKWVIGHEALNAKPSKQKQATKQAAAARVDAAKGKSTSARSDAASYTGKGSTEEERLRGVFI